MLIRVPEVERIVGPWHVRFDSSAAVGVPAHITLIYPFLPAHRLDAEVFAALETIFAAMSPFSFTLAELRRFEKVLYLAPEPAQPFNRLIGALTARFPEAPPYGGIHDTVIPHLTVAEGDQRILDDVTQALTAFQPIEVAATSVSLMEQDAQGRWRTWRHFALGRSG